MHFIDLQAQQARLKDKIDARIADVLAHGQYILGPEVTEFETALAAFTDANHAISCANGTDALLLPMMAWGIGPGDAVFCPSFTYCATAEAVAMRGATPIFVDIDRDTYTMAPESLSQAIADVKARGQLTPKAVITVDLFGQPADYPALAPIVREAGLYLISDCAQGLGCRLNGQSPMHWADAMTTSFFPAKPLGCYGDGGAVMTNDDALKDALLSLRFHGRGGAPGNHERIGLNSRLDSIQAAILLVKIDAFAEEIEARNRIAARYSDALSPHVRRVPKVIDGGLSSWAQYCVEVDAPQSVQDALKAQGVPTARYYPLPVHKQTAYVHFPVAGNGLPHTEQAGAATLALPMYPDMTEADQERVIAALISAVSA